MPSANSQLGIIAITLVIFILIIGMVVVILLARKERLSQALKEANYQARLNEVSFASLRSQMNPHFIFNCLNSIKLFTEQNNSEAASEYLSKFSLIIRHTLNNARREKVLLAEEIASIKLYLELEAMRFNEKFMYAVDIDNNVDVDFIEMPPMLVQPYVENAIWHGLMQKKEGGKLIVHFSQIEDGSLLVITIADNGIGRKRASELNSKTAEEHKSFGTQITSERIDLLNERQQGLASVTIEDLYNDAAEADGTLVTIKLPIK